MVHRLREGLHPSRQMRSMGAAEGSGGPTVLSNSAAGRISLNRSSPPADKQGVDHEAGCPGGVGTLHSPTPSFIHATMLLLFGSSADVAEIAGAIDQVPDPIRSS